jgi:branched-chain amino acid transport system substrate-binding protein
MRKNRGRALIQGLLLLLWALALPGCRGGRQPVPEMRIGLIAMLSGSASDQASGRSMQRGARLAVEQANRAGGRRVSLVLADDRNSPEGAIEAARRLIFEERVPAIIGPQFSRNAIPAARLAEREKTVMICPLSTNPQTTAEKLFVFRVPYLDTFQGASLARFARRDLRAARAAVLYDVANEYNRTLAEVFRETFSRLGGRITAFETYTTDQAADFGPQLGRIAAAGAEVLFLPNLNDDVLRQGRQARRLGIRAVLLGGDGWDPDALAAEPAFAGSFAARHWHPAIATREALAFLRAFRERYRETPDDIAATTYDACGLLVAAMRAAGSAEPEAIRRALLGMEAYPGVTGSILYRGSGDPSKSVVLVGIQAGGVSVRSVLEPE